MVPWDHPTYREPGPPPQTTSRSDRPFFHNIHAHYQRIDRQNDQQNGVGTGPVRTGRLHYSAMITKGRIPRHRGSSPTRPTRAIDFLKLFLWQAKREVARHAEILATILASMLPKMSVTVSWNVALTTTENKHFSYRQWIAAISATIGTRQHKIRWLGIKQKKSSHAKISRSSRIAYTLEVNCIIETYMHVQQKKICDRGQRKTQR